MHPHKTLTINHPKISYFKDDINLPVNRLFLLQFSGHPAAIFPISARKFFNYSFSYKRKLLNNLVMKLSLKWL